MKEKQYKELTTNEKMIVGYIYDLYTEWVSQRLGLNYLKNSLFSDFCYEFKIKNTPLKEYADYFYLWGYYEEQKIEDTERGYGYIVPKTALFTLQKELNNKLETFFNEQEEKENNTFFLKKMFNL